MSGFLPPLPLCANSDTLPTPFALGEATVTLWRVPRGAPAV